MWLLPVPAHCPAEPRLECPSWSFLSQVCLLAEVPSLLTTPCGGTQDPVRNSCGAEASGLRQDHAASQPKAGFPLTGPAGGSSAPQDHREALCPKRAWPCSLGPHVCKLWAPWLGVCVPEDHCRWVETGLDTETIRGRGVEKEDRISQPWCQAPGVGWSDSLGLASWCCCWSRSMTRTVNWIVNRWPSSPSSHAFPPLRCHAFLSTQYMQEAKIHPR